MTLAALPRPTPPHHFRFCGCSRTCHNTTCTCYLLMRAVPANTTWRGTGGTCGLHRWAPAGIRVNTAVPSVLRGTCRRGTRRAFYFPLLPSAYSRSPVTDAPAMRGGRHLPALALPCPHCAFLFATIEHFLPCGHTGTFTAACHRTTLPRVPRMTAFSAPAATLRACCSLHSINNACILPQLHPARLRSLGLPHGSATAPYCVTYTNRHRYLFCAAIPPPTSWMVCRLFSRLRSPEQRAPHAPRLVRWPHLPLPLATRYFVLPGPGPRHHLPARVYAITLARFSHSRYCVDTLAMVILRSGCVIITSRTRWLRFP